MIDSPTITERAWRSQGNPWYQRVYRLRPTNPGRVVKMRTTIRIDFYQFQSWAKVERWDGNQWQTVVHRAGETLTCWATVRATPRIAVLTDEDFEPDVTEVDAEAWEVLR